MVVPGKGPLVTIIQDLITDILRTHNLKGAALYSFQLAHRNEALEEYFCGCSAPSDFLLTRFKRSISGPSSLGEHPRR